MYRLADTLDPDRYYALARAVYGEMALAGITCVGEFHYVHHGPAGRPYDEPNAMSEALIAAAHDAGLRITLLDTCYLRGGFDAPLDATQLRFSDGDADRWATRLGALKERRGLRIGAAIHSVRAVDPAAMRVVAEWALTNDAPLHAHVSEQHAENEQCLDVHGCTPTTLLDDHAALTAHFTAVHATHLTANDIARYGRAGATCCLCPTTERDLADGIGPSGALVDAGVTLSLGTDSHAVIDLFEEARAVELDERLATNVRGRHRAAALGRAATANGHACLGWPDAGCIEVGALADLVTVSLDSVRLAGTETDHALPSIVFAATAADVRHVVIGGEVIVRDGHHTRLDVAGELRRTLAALWEAT
jgi:formiminoglutamate deiminase